ncbi:MAG: hypothetical protein U0401_27555 [Anaerolineae bacterium]
MKASLPVILAIQPLARTMAAELAAQGCDIIFPVAERPASVVPK